MSVIVLAGMISSGKTSVSEVLGNALGTEVFYEKVEGNEILPLFYTAPKEEQVAKRYPFLLQLEFLNSRFKDIKDAFYNQNNVVDRSIYEDLYFAKVNTDLGQISAMEFKIYNKLLNNMLEELETLPKKAPDLLVYLKCSFETIIYRIGLRGRAFEQDPELFAYYKKLWEGYDDWVYNHYNASEVITIDMDKMDVVNRQADSETVVKAVTDKLAEMRGI